MLVLPQVQYVASSASGKRRYKMYLHGTVR